MVCQGHRGCAERRWNTDTTLKGNHMDMTEAQRAQFNNAVSAFMDAQHVLDTAKKQMKDALAHLNSVCVALDMPSEQRERIHAMLNAGFAVTA